MDDTGFASPTGINWNGKVGTVEYGGGDRGMIALFYMHPRHNPAKSAEAGRPIYEDVAYVRIQPPGERLNIVDRPVQPNDKNRFPMQWAQFMQNKEQRPDGTPIDMLYADKPAVGAMLKANNVFTIEQCATLSGPAIDQIGMGAQQYSNDAKKYVEMANKGVGASQLRHELEERDRQIRVLEQQITQLRAEMGRMQSETANGPNLQQIQQMLAGVMARPTYVPGANFDPATAQINANHATADIARSKGATAPKRKRARVAT